MRNRQIVLRSRPSGTPNADTFALVETALPEPAPGEILVRHDWLGLAPAARLRMSEVASYAAPLPIGSPIYGQAVGEVVQSRNSAFAEGDAVMISDGGWQEYSISNGASAKRIDLAVAPAPAWLGHLGVSGFTAYVGMQDFVLPRAGETIVVSAASGAVGSAAIQIARIAGARTVGIAGTAEKCAYVVDVLGANACVQHRGEDFPDALSRACPDGVDAYFDNVGGVVRDAVWTRMKDFGRIAVCGLVSQYNAQNASGPDWFALLTKRLSVRGFMLRDHPQRYDAFVRDMSGWLASGQIEGRDHVSNGLESAPEAFIGMLEGRNFGKTLIKLDQR